MKKMVALFAHPDDEAFGPGGTIVKMSREYEITVICVTGGEAGKNVGSIHTRKKELEKSAQILGVRHVIFLDFKDGDLSNNQYHKLANVITKKLNEIKPEAIMTFDIKGVSGHIDHIVISLVSRYIFERLAYIKKLFYYCLDFERSKLYKDYFIYFPEGYKKDEINKIVDVSDVWEIKVSAMMAHESQRHDADNILKKTAHLPKKEHFIVIEK